VHLQLWHVPSTPLNLKLESTTKLVLHASC